MQKVELTSLAVTTKDIQGMGRINVIFAWNQVSLANHNTDIKNRYDMEVHTAQVQPHELYV